MEHRAEKLNTAFNQSHIELLFSWSAPCYSPCFGVQSTAAWSLEIEHCPFNSVVHSYSLRGEIEDCPFNAARSSFDICAAFSSIGPPMTPQWSIPLHTSRGGKALPACNACFKFSKYALIAILLSGDHPSADSEVLTGAPRSVMTSSIFCSTVLFTISITCTCSKLERPTINNDALPNPRTTICNTSLKNNTSPCGSH